MLPACTEVLPGLLPQPEMFKIVTEIDRGPPSLTLLTKPCNQPTIRACPGGNGIGADVSIIGKAAIDRLVEISFPEKAPLAARICIGVLGKLVAGSIVSLEGLLIRH